MAASRGAVMEKSQTLKAGVVASQSMSVSPSLLRELRFIVQRLTENVNNLCGANSNEMKTWPGLRILQPAGGELETQTKTGKSSSEEA